MLITLLTGCSLTPIPDVTSQYSEPCGLDLRVCAWDFRLTATHENSVEVRGSFRLNGWLVGESMRREGDLWLATVPLPWGVPVQYKFYVDGGRWLADPANPRTIPDGNGNINSLLENVTCPKWSCAP